MTSIPLMPAITDVQHVLYHSGTDMLMFVAAMLAYFVLQQIRARAVETKPSAKETPIFADQECPLPREKICTIHPLPLPCKAPCHANTPDLPCRSLIQPEASVSKPKVLAEVPFDLSAHITLMQRYAATRNIKDTLRIFKLIEQKGERVTSSMYNTVMRAWINCGNIWAAENLLQQAIDVDLADESSYAILIKSLVSISDLEKAHDLMNAMKEARVPTGITPYDEILLGFAKVGRFDDDCISLLREVGTVGLQPSSITFDVLSKVVNSVRRTQRFTTIEPVLSEYAFSAKLVGDFRSSASPQPPRLAALLARAAKAQTTSAACIHDVEIKGSLARIEAVRTMLEQRGFVNSEPEAAGQSPSEQLEMACCFMTEVLCDEGQDRAYQARSASVLKCVSKHGLCMPHFLEASLIPFLGKGLYSVQLHFEQRGIYAEILDDISCRHPRLGLRHCWVKPSTNSCGQRTLVNGEETDEACFNRHIEALSLA